METKGQNYDRFHSQEFGPITDVIWDGDNTIWDWMKYAVEAYEAMALAIAEETGKPEPEVAAAMKKFYTKAGTIEDERLIQGLTNDGFFNGIANFDRDRLIQKAQKAFTNARRKNLHVYHGAYKAFKTIHEHGVSNRILTDAPERQARLRIKRSRLGPLLKHVNALPSNNDPDLPQTFRDLEKAGKYDVDFDVTEIPWEKPYTNLEKILTMTREDIRRHIVIIGDNDRKDMELVRVYGCRGIHAVYGETTEDLLKRLLRFAPEKVTKKNSSLMADNLPSAREEIQKKLNGGSSGLIVKVDSPSEILKVLGMKPKRKW